MNVQESKAIPRADDFASRVRWGIFFYVSLLVTVYAALLVVYAPEIARFFFNVWIFAPIGVVGALIANATGTGGGVVFVPAFNFLSEASKIGSIPMEIAIAPANIVGISFLIQCFGMSVGSSVWIYRFFGTSRSLPADKLDANTFLAIVFAVVVTCVPGLLVTQYAFFGVVDGRILIAAFKWFSLVLGVVLLIFTWAYRRARPSRHVLEYSDVYWLMALGIVGGVVTAFFSVGVGEFVAVYLILRKFPPVASVAAAVVISALTVLAGVGYHIGNNNIVWPIALMAVPGAMIGGFLARVFALWLGPLWLKTCASVWIIVSSAFLIVGPWLGWLAS